MNTQTLVDDIKTRLVELHQLYDEIMYLEAKREKLLILYSAKMCAEFQRDAIV